MQIKDNITATSNPVNANLQGPIKMVKLRSKDIVSQNSDKLMEPTWVTETKQEIREEVNQPETKEVTPQVETPVTNEVKEEPKEVVNLPLTSEEVIRAKKDLLGIDAYTDIDANVVNLSSYQNARRLRVNEVVVGNANRERNINGTERVKENIDTKVSDNENKTFDFSSLGNIGETRDIQTEKDETPEYDNNSKLDEWLNKETGTSSKSNDKVLNEVNELQAKLNDNTSSLATQKEILEALRARIANNEALCKARKKELEEENMNVTRELNDVLAEINQLTSLANEQEAFLGIQNDDDSKGMGMAA